MWPNPAPPVARGSPFRTGERLPQFQSQMCSTARRSPSQPLGVSPAGPPRRNAPSWVSYPTAPRSCPRPEPVPEPAAGGGSPGQKRVQGGIRQGLHRWFLLTNGAGSTHLLHSSVAAALSQRNTPLSPPPPSPPHSWACPPRQAAPSRAPLESPPRPSPPSPPQARCVPRSHPPLHVGVQRCVRRS